MSMTFTPNQVMCDVRSCRALVELQHAFICPLDDQVICWRCAKASQLRAGAAFIASLTPLDATDPQTFQVYAGRLADGLETLRRCDNPEFWAVNADAGIEWLLTWGAEAHSTWGLEDAPVGREEAA